MHSARLAEPSRARREKLEREAHATAWLERHRRVRDQRHGADDGDDGDPDVGTLSAAGSSSGSASDSAAGNNFALLDALAGRAGDELERVLGMLPPRDRAVARCVSTALRAAASDEDYWAEQLRAAGLTAEGLAL